MSVGLKNWIVHSGVWKRSSCEAAWKEDLSEESENGETCY